MDLISSFKLKVLLTKSVMGKSQLHVSPPLTLVGSRKSSHSRRPSSSFFKDGQLSALKSNRTGSCSTPWNFSTLWEFTTEKAALYTAPPSGQCGEQHSEAKTISDYGDTNSQGTLERYDSNWMKTVERTYLLDMKAHTYNPSTQEWNPAFSSPWSPNLWHVIHLLGSLEWKVAMAPTPYLHFEKLKRKWHYAWGGVGKRV